MRTLAVWVGEGFGENFEYDLKGTPCEDILRFNRELIPADASSLYPDDEMLVQMGIEGYFGAPLISKEQNIIGIVSVMDTKPMALGETTAPVLGIFASRIATELQGKFAFDELKRLNAALEERTAEPSSSNARLEQENAERRRVEAELIQAKGQLQQKSEELEKRVAERTRAIGIEPRCHEQIFGLFDRLNQEKEGTGLGLAIVQRVIEAHAGRLWVESEGKGRGSTFCFTLPDSDRVATQT